MSCTLPKRALLFALFSHLGFSAAAGSGAFEDSFTRSANGGPYADWTSISAMSDDWVTGRFFLFDKTDGSSDQLIPKDEGAKSKELGDGGAHLRSGANGQFALLYAGGRTEAASPFTVRAGIEALGPRQKGGLAFGWDPAGAVDEGANAYLFQAFNGDATGGGAPLAVRLIRYDEAIDAGKGQAPSPTAVLLEWTPLEGFDALPDDMNRAADPPLVLEASWDGEDRLTLRAEQGDASWETTLSPASFEPNGLAGVAVQRGNGLEEGHGNFGQLRVDRFFLSGARPIDAESAAPESRLGNVLSNSGFELGHLGIGLGRLGGDAAAARVVKSPEALEGRRALRMTLTENARRMGYRASEQNPDNRGYWIQFEGVRVEPGVPYIFSVYVRGDPHMKAALGVTIGGRLMWELPITSDFESVGSSWKRISMTIPADLPYRDPAGLLPILFIDAEQGRPGTVWFDAMQLEPGTAPTPYRLAGGIDLGVTTTELLNIFDDRSTNSIAARVAVSNGDAADRTVEIPFQLKSWDDRILREDTIRLRVPAGMTVDKRVDLGHLPKGYTIGDFRVKGSNEGQWLRLAVIRKRPVPISDASRSNAVFNMHVFRGPACTTDAAVWAGARGGREYQASWRTPPDMDPDIPARRGEWHSTRSGRVMLKERNLHTLIGINQDPLWIEGVEEKTRRHQIDLLPRSPEEMTSMLKTWAERNRDWLDAVESRNEVYNYIPMPDGDVSGFMEYFRLFYESIKSVAPEMDVVHNVVYDINSIHNLLGAVMEAGLEKYMDILSFHYYGFGAVAPERYVARYVEDIQAVMRTHGAEDMPLYMTEGGGGSIACEDDPYLDKELAALPPLRANERDVARLLVRFHLVGLSMGIERFYYFLPFDHQGVLSRNNCAGLLRWDGLPRYGYAAYAHMTEMLEDRTFVERIDRAEDGLRGYLFEGDSDAVLAFCRGANGVRGSIGIPADSLLARGAMTDMMGGPLNWDRAAGEVLQSAFDPHPRYLRFAKRDAVDTAAIAKAFAAAEISVTERPPVQSLTPPQPEGTTYFMEAEDPFESTGGDIEHQPGLYSGKGWGDVAWLRDMPEGGYRASYGFYVVGTGLYAPWIAASPVDGFGEGDQWTSPMEYRINGGEWKSVSKEHTSVTWPKSGYGVDDVHTLYWMKQEPVRLETGEHTIELRVSQARDFDREAGDPRVVFLVDALAIAKEEE